MSFSRIRKLTPESERVSAQPKQIWEGVVLPIGSVILDKHL